ncbi:hypothetical protein [Pseudomonas entomophila]|uniref:hypothetical protein n=1 Tax=Pseudomonas entomophila TaxID=312306 RepID=UPI00201045E3|nr:hypothetical protein [Pseudomonas entomophila]
MNFIIFIHDRLHAPARKALPCLRPPHATAQRLRATWLPQLVCPALRLHWHTEDTQEPPSRWRARLCFC